MLICVMMNQVITSLFAFFAMQIDPTMPSYIVTGFSIATCGLMGFWLQGDMLRAYQHAKTRRWLVILYIELNPAIVGK